MTITAEAVRKLAQELKDRNEHESWRKIAESYGNPIIKAGTLCRIAREAGEWIPKDKEILIALGLVKAHIKEPQPEWLVKRKKAIRRMVKDTKISIFRKG
jgi:hypothetical protein